MCFKKKCAEYDDTFQNPRKRFASYVYPNTKNLQNAVI